VTPMQLTAGLGHNYLNKTQKYNIWVSTEVGSVKIVEIAVPSKASFSFAERFVMH
jgi:hypothetical protein